MSDTKQIDDGGPAFPSDNFGQPSALGMSLRDWFAGMALQGLCAHYGFGEIEKDAANGYVYTLADAMLQARKEAR